MSHSKLVCNTINYLHKRKTGLGSVSQAAEEGDDKVLDVGIGFSPHVDGSLLEERFLLGVQQSPHQRVSPDFRVLLTIKKDGEKVVAEGKSVFLKEGLKSSHGGITNSAFLVLVLNNVDKNMSGSWEVDIPERNDGLGLFFETGSSGDSVREDLDVLVQKSGLLTTSLFAGATEKGGVGKFDKASTVLAYSRLGKKGFQLLEKGFGWVADVVGQRCDGTANDQSFRGFLNNVTDDKGGWASSSDNKSVQEEFAEEKNSIFSYTKLGWDLTIKVVKYK